MTELREVATVVLTTVVETTGVLTTVDNSVEVDANKEAIYVDAKDMYWALKLS